MQNPATYSRYDGRGLDAGVGGGVLAVAVLGGEPGDAGTMDETA